MRELILIQPQRTATLPGSCSIYELQKAISESDPKLRVTTWRSKNLARGGKLLVSRAVIRASVGDTSATRKIRWRHALDVDTSSTLLLATDSLNIVSLATLAAVLSMQR